MDFRARVICEAGKHLTYRFAARRYTEIRGLDMRRQRVPSSGVVSVGYDDWSKTLEIEFPGGAIYDYAHVPEVLYRDLLQAESKGRFVNLYIKPYFEHEEIETGATVIYATEEGQKRRSAGRAPAPRRNAPRRPRRRAR